LIIEIIPLKDGKAVLKTTMWFPLPPEEMAEHWNDAIEEAILYLYHFKFDKKNISDEFIRADKMKTTKVKAL
jgi:hypothetical protein